MANQKVKLSVGDLSTFEDYYPVNGEICFVKHSNMYYSVGLMDQGEYLEVKDFQIVNASKANDSIKLEGFESYYELYRNFTQSLGSTFHAISLSVDGENILFYPYKISTHDSQLTMMFITPTEYFLEQSIKHSKVCQLSLTLDLTTKSDVSSSLETIKIQTDQTLYWNDF